jgi:hypothetical protein
VNPDAQQFGNGGVGGFVERETEPRCLGLLRGRWSGQRSSVFVFVFAEPPLCPTRAPHLVDEPRIARIPRAHDRVPEPLTDWAVG